MKSIPAKCTAAPTRRSIRPSPTAAIASASQPETGICRDLAGRGCGGRGLNPRLRLRRGAQRAMGGAGSSERGRLGRPRAPPAPRDAAGAERAALLRRAVRHFRAPPAARIRRARLRRDAPRGRGARWIGPAAAFPGGLRRPPPAAAPLRRARRRWDARFAARVGRALRHFDAPHVHGARRIGSPAASRRRRPLAALRARR